MIFFTKIVIEDRFEILLFWLIFDIFELFSTNSKNTKKFNLLASKIKKETKLLGINC